jgi:hypothetical protein
MSTHKAIIALAQHWSGVVDALNTAGRAALAEILAEARAASDRRILKLRLVSLLIDALPVDHPVRRAAADDDTDLSTAVAEAASDEALAYLIGVLADLERRVFSNREAAEPEPAATVAQILAEARRRLLATPCLTREALVARGADPTEPNVIRLLAADGTDRFPTFQFLASGATRPVVGRVNEILGAATDPWGVADWWLSAHSGLGRRPAELLTAADASVDEENAAELLTAARATAEV